MGETGARKQRAQKLSSPGNDYSAMSGVEVVTMGLNFLTTFRALFFTTAFFIAFLLAFLCSSFWPALS